MAATVTERPDSRDWTDVTSGTLLYNITGCADEAAALVALKATAPATQNGLVRGKCIVKPLEADECWAGEAPYKTYSMTQEPLEVGETSFSFEVGGGS